MFSLVFFAVFGALSVGLLRVFHRSWFSDRRVRWAIAIVLLLGAIGVGLRMLGKSASISSPLLVTMGAVFFAVSGILVLASIVSLPMAAVVRTILRVVLRDRAATKDVASVATSTTTDAKKVETPTVETVPSIEAPRAELLRVEPRVSRRAMIEIGTAAVPAAAFGVGLTGVAEAFRETAIVERQMSFPTLPDALRGLRILHLTDLHVGAFLDPADVRGIMERAASLSPDLVVITGDFADHLPSVEGALKEVLALRPKHGTYAVLGNHEHFGGADRHRRIYDRVGVDMLVDAHRTLRVDNRELVIAGVNDPIRRGAPNFYDRAADAALSGAPSDAFVLGLCHRPSGFETLASRGVDLTLSGHTHGAQMGIAERSVFEPSFAEARLWGRYAIGDKQLYTSSGGGHWFAFRIGCPSEAPLIVLTG
jgi:uncharacterized protein